MKQRISICLEKKLIEAIDYLKKNKYDGLPSRSSIIENYLRERVFQDVSQLKRDKDSKPRVLA